MKIRFLRVKWKDWWWKRSILALSAIGFFLLSTHMEALAKENYFENEKISLTEALYRISTEYQVFFSYDQEAVQDVVVNYEPDRYENVEHALDRMLVGTSLHYRMFNNRYIILYESHPEAINSLRDMVQHLESVIDKEENETVRRVTPPLAALPSRTKAFTVAPVVFSVNGTVTDQEGDPLIGVNIQVKGSSKGTSTDFDGNFTLEDIDENAVLVISYVGYQTQEISVAGKLTLEIVMMSDAELLDEVVVVGYGTQRKIDMTGSVATLEGEEIVKSGNTNITNSFAGRLPGITAVSGNGKPGVGSQITIRGISTFGDNSPLIVIDGIVRTIDQVDPNEIASISILKDASATAVYGSRAANGVILITTKRGEIGEPVISYNGFAGIQNPTAYPELMNGYQYAITRNAARENMGLSPMYSESEIEEIRQGLWEETDWYDLTLNNAAFQAQHNLNISGGSDVVKYYLSTGYLDQDGLYESLNYKRYSVLSNIDANINNNFKISLNIDASRRNNNQSAYSPEAIFSDIMAAYPFDKVYNPDGSIFYTEEQHPVEEIRTGYHHIETNLFQSTLDLKHKIPFVSGLSIFGKAAYGKEVNDHKTHNVPILMNRQDDEGNTLEIYPYGGWNGKTALNQHYSDYNTMLINLGVDFEKHYGSHEMKFIGFYEQFNATSKNFTAFRTNFPAISLDELLFGGDLQKDAQGGSFDDGRRSYVARIDYVYDKRYMLESSVRIDGSVAFPTTNKYGVFPAFSIGWRLTEEKFMKERDNFDYLDNLKIRASYGLVGNDRNVYSGRIPTFQYQQVYNLSSPVVFGSEVHQSISPGVLPNPKVTWENAAILNLGLDASFFKGALDLEVDLFDKITSNILLSRIRSIPATLGAELPAENYAKVNNKGFEISASHKNHIRDFSFFIKGNMSYAKNKVILLDEPANIPHYLRQTGRPLDFIVGYKAIGFFQSDEDVDSYIEQFNGGQEAGDVKYEDVNGDGVVDANDRTIISYDNHIPKILGGLTFGGSYKGFDLNVFIQGATKMKKLLTGRSITFFHGGSHNNFVDLLDYWTPENPDAKYPRPWQWDNPNNNRESNLYLRDASYIRLKSIDLGFTLPENIRRMIKAKSFRIYISGTNLLLFDKMKMFDPEVENTDGAYYPQQRTVNFGINVSF